MAVDLYKDDFSSLTDEQVYQAIEAFTRIADPEASRPRESYVLDFKEKWNERALRTVAGFAHTFGGLLIVGVSETADAQADKLVGVECRGELQTAIASSIATNISLTPAYAVTDCRLPSEPTRRLAVVRVRSGHQLHYLTKQGEQPIYVRNETESKPANAAQLRSLIERRSQPTQTDAARRSELLRNNMNLTRIHPSNANPLRMSLVPIDCPVLTLDSSIEQTFRKLLSNITGFIYGAHSPNCDLEEKLDVHSFEWRWFLNSPECESAWRLNSMGEVGMVTQARIESQNGTSWSLGDLMAELWFLLAFSREFWKQTASFFGDARLDLTLSASTIGMNPFSTKRLWHQDYQLFTRDENYNSNLNNSITSQPSVPPPAQVTAAGIFSAGSPNASVADLIANIANQVLRGFGYSADLKLLQRATNLLVTP